MFKDINRRIKNIGGGIGRPEEIVKRKEIIKYRKTQTC